MFVIGVLLLSSVSADQKVISTENDFKDGSFSDMQLNLNPSHACDTSRYTSAGYDYPDTNTNPSGTCNRCDGYGSIQFLPSGQDPFSECGTTNCLTGTCNGAGACGYYTSGQHNCASGYECNANGICVALPKRCFVTSTQTWGELGGLAGADQYCNTRASAAGLGGTWTAWLSTNYVNAKDRIADHTYYRVDGITKVCDNLADLTDGSIDNSISYNEFGNYVNNYAHTSTKSDGTYDTSRGHCQGWTSRATADTSWIGFTIKADGSWTRDSTGGCSMKLHLYCFED